MPLPAIDAFVRTPTKPAEVESLTGGRGLHLPPDVQAEFARLTTVDNAEQATANVLEIRELIPAGDLFHSAVLAMLCGALVEGGASPEAAVDATLELFLRQLDALAEQPDETTVAAGNLTFMATMAMLCRSPETRKRWRTRPEVMDRLDELEEAELTPYFLREVFTLHDDRDLLVLDPKNRRAFRFRMVGVRDRLYHCYALLQDALLRHAGPGYLDAEPVDPAAVRYARNHGLTRQEYGPRPGFGDHQRFGFTHPGGMFLPGSASPESLPNLDGTWFLVVQSKQMGFQWDPTNMYPVVHDALKASVELVEELDGEQAENLLSRIGATPEDAS